MTKKIIIFYILIIVSLPVLAQRNNKENQYLYPENTKETNTFGHYYRRALDNKTSNNFLSIPSDVLEFTKELERSNNILPLDGFLDPAEYYIGPNDILDINIWGEIPLTLPVIVAPDGSLVITGIGEVQLKDKSLADAKELVSQEVKKKFKATSISVTLKNPRLFYVSVIYSLSLKDVRTFIVSSADRVHKAVSLAVLQMLEEGSEKIITDRNIDFGSNIDFDKKVNYFNQEKLEKDEYSLRNIKVFRRNGDTIKVDLVKYFSMGDIESNPYLRDGDIVFIPKEDLEANSIAIYGEVNNPGLFEYCKGDKITTALRIALGNLEKADLKNVELTRLDEDWSGFNTSIVNLEAIIEKKAEDIELLPGDRIFIRPLYKTKQVKEIEIKGEVFSPGKYPIIKGKTKLTDVIKLAGGFTEYASLAEAKIIRKSISDDKIQQNPDYVRLENMRLGAVDKLDVEYITLEEALKRGSVAVDFKKIFIENDKNSDITLEGDEIIYIPIKTNSVYVLGQVNNPGYITITGNADYKYYIEKAGGYSESAKKKDVVIIKAGSKEWKDPSTTKIESGDIIWVPKKIYHDYLTWMEIFRDIGSVLGAASTLTLIIIQIFR
jgi:protein involved in polysaccharide export with SLBB domain